MRAFGLLLSYVRIFGARQICTMDEIWDIAAEEQKLQVIDHEPAAESEDHSEDLRSAICERYDLDALT